jgi:signal transduction histidine kinase
VVRDVLLVAMAAVLVLRRRAPVAVWLVEGALVTTYGILPLNDPTLPYAALVAVFTVAAHTRARTAAWALLVTLVSLVIALSIDAEADFLDWLVNALAITSAWLLGFTVSAQRAYGTAMAERAAALERDRADAEQRAIAEERLRLARELHDVTAHHVGVIALHAEAGQATLPDDPARAAASFEVIAGVARDALHELRSVVGMLRESAGDPRRPQPGLDQLPTLAAEVGHAGVPVTLAVRGEPRPLGAALEASAYRIVQEALTNVLRHAGARHAEVTVTYEEGAVDVEVADDGAGPLDVATVGGGNGITGMRERASVFGGELTAAARPGGGFVVTARLPT